MDKTIRKVGIAVFKDKKILMARSKKNAEVFYLPGGKFQPGESDKDCILRECKEELGADIIPENLEYLNEFEDVAHGQPEGTMVNIKLYKCELQSEPAPNSEIAEIKYFDSANDQKNLSILCIHKVFPWLKENGYIN